MTVVGKIVKMLIYVAAAILLVYMLWLLCRIFLFDQFVIPTESMSPTLLPGDRVVVDKRVMGARIYSDIDFNPDGGELHSWRTRGLRTLKHNDIVVFNFPHHDWKISFIINNVFCKRILALPGDTISIVEGFYRNNNYEEVLGLEEEQKKYTHLPEDESWRKEMQTYPYDEHIKWTPYNWGPMYVPRKGDVIRITPHEAALYGFILEWELGKKVTRDWKTGEVRADGNLLTRHQFKHNYYFMAGDNVLDSDDSRFWGLVPEEYIVGVAKYITYSVNSQIEERRGNRLLKKV